MSDNLHPGYNGGALTNLTQGDETDLDCVAGYAASGEKTKAKCKAAGEPWLLEGGTCEKIVYCCSLFISNMFVS